MNKFNIFISWSKCPADSIAEELAVLLNKVIPDELNVYVSSSNNHGIDAGENFHIALNNELNKSNFGILVLTKYNIGAYWLMFEAGAISKHKSSRVVPILFDRDIQDIESPITGFTYIEFKKEDFKKLITSIKKSILKSEEIALENIQNLEMVLDNKWDKFFDKVNTILKEYVETIDPMSIMMNHSVYDFVLSKREDHLLTLINNLNNDKLSKRMIIFGGISTILREETTIKAFGRWLLQDHNPKIFICHETKEALIERSKYLHGDIINQKVDKIEREKQAEEKISKIIEMKKNLIKHTADVAKNRLFFVQVPKLISSFITIEGVIMYLTPALDKRSSETFTFKLKPSNLNEQLLDFISNHIDYTTNDNIMLLEEIGIIKIEMENLR